MALSVLPHRDDLMRAAAERVAHLAQRAIAARGHFAWALAGGKTPEALYRLLATAPHASHIDWTRVHFFWSDERCVPPDHADSNYRMARESLLDRVQPPQQNVHRMQGEQPPHSEALRYETVLGASSPPPPGSTGSGSTPPRLDLILLGMGADGHTASLFPGDPALSERERWVTSARVAGPGVTRLTFTLPLINAAAEVLFLVSGRDKAPALARVLGKAGSAAPAASPASGAGGGFAGALPAQLVHPSNGLLEWFVDAEAASLL